MKTLLKALIAATPYKVVHRMRGNRFSAIEESLLSMRSRGFSPPWIIDCGANIGEFSSFVLKYFPEAFVDAIEPQPGCAGILERLKAVASGCLEFHQVAVCAPEDDGTMLALAANATSTSGGAHIVPSAIGNGSTLSVPSITLDRLLKQKHTFERGALLKLDIQGYELHALRGASETLMKCDVVLCEVSFYAQAYEPPISRLVAHLADHGFELHDIGGIFARPRDDRPRQGDFIFVRTNCPLATDTAWS